jgi:dihydrofolate synthase / folylpolyglutamate synthase
MTAIAFSHFSRLRVDVAVLEVGMGGRLDATNVVEPLLSVITDISLDHQKFLGNTVSEIASEKAGVIRSRGIVVTLPQQPAANDVIGNAILELDAVGVSAARYVPPVSPASTQYLAPVGQSNQVRSCYPLEVLGGQILVDTPLVGRHQLRNVALAIAAAEEAGNKGLPGITLESIERGIRETAWPGRFQVIEAKQGWPEIVLDVAHNPAGAWALRSALSERFEDRPLIFVFGAMRDKAISEMAEILFPLAQRVIATRPANPRSASPEEIREAASRSGADIEEVNEVGSALVRARNCTASETGHVGTAPWAVLRSEASSTPTRAVVVVTGSIYLVGEAMQFLGLRT